MMTSERFYHPRGDGIFFPPRTSHSVLFFPPCFDRKHILLSYSLAFIHLCYIVCVCLFHIQGLGPGPGLWTRWNGTWKKHLPRADSVPLLFFAPSFLLFISLRFVRWRVFFLLFCSVTMIRFCLQRILNVVLPRPLPFYPTCPLGYSFLLPVGNGMMRTMAVHGWFFHGEQKRKICCYVVLLCFFCCWVCVVGFVVLFFRALCSINQPTCEQKLLCTSSEAPGVIRVRE